MKRHSMFRNVVPSLLAASGLALLVSACGGGGGGGGGGAPANGTMTVAATDAPFPFAMITQANVVVTEIAIHENGDGFAVIDTSTHALDLVQLQQGKQALLVNASVPPGSVDQIRLKIASGTVVLTDGRSFNLTVPSGDASGLKVFINPPIVITSGLTSSLVLDFDMSQSFEPVPNSAQQAADVKDFLFHPVIRASVAQDSSSISGKVTMLQQPGTPVAGATVTVTKSDGTLTQNVSTGTDGSFVVGFLTPGTYIVTASKNGLTTASQVVTVTSANNVTVNLQI